MTTIRTIRIRGIEFDSANEAIQYEDAGGRGRAICIGRRHFVIGEAEGHRIAALGVSFAYLGVWERGDGREVVITTPIN